MRRRFIFLYALLCSKKMPNLAQTLEYVSSKMSVLVKEQNIKFEQNRKTFYYIQKYEASTRKEKISLNVLYLVHMYIYKIFG